MRRLLRSSLSGLVMATVAMVLVAGCAWPMYGGNAGRTGLNPGESSIGIGNVATVQLRWSAPSTGSIVVGNGMLYQVGALTSSPSSPRVLRAYDPLGTRGCTGSPASCTPLWSASIPGVGFTGVADVNGVVYTSGGGRVYAYDSAGAMGCGGSPKTCQPLWSADGSSTAPLVDAGKVFVTATDGTGDILAYDAAGSVGCGGVPKVCSPRFRGVIDCAALFPGRTPCTLDNLLTAGNGRVYRSLSILDPVAGSIAALVSYDEAGAPRSTASTSWPSLSASERHCRARTPTPSAHATPSAGLGLWKDLQRRFGARPRWRENSMKAPGVDSDRHPPARASERSPLRRACEARCIATSGGGAGGVDGHRRPSSPSV